MISSSQRKENQSENLSQTYQAWVCPALIGHHFCLYWGSFSRGFCHYLVDRGWEEYKMSFGSDFKHEQK